MILNVSIHSEVDILVGMVYATIAYYTQVTVV